MRLTLAIVLTVAQLAGPWLCCCGPTRVTTAVAGSVSKVPPVEHGSHGGCPHCKKEVPACPPTDDAPKAPHAPDRCPCGGVMAVPAVKTTLPAFDSLLVVVWVVPPLPIASAVVAPRVVVGLRELPHLTTADRLFAHHVLRC